MLQCVSSNIPRLPMPALCDKSSLFAVDREYGATGYRYQDMVRPFRVKKKQEMAYIFSTFEREFIG